VLVAVLMRGKGSVLALVLAGGLVAAWAATAAAAGVERVRSASTADSTRVVIDLSSSVDFTYATLRPDSKGRWPFRVYVDLKGVSNGNVIDTSRVTADARVSRIRAAQFTNDTARVVIDLKMPVKVTVGSLRSAAGSPARVYIDLQTEPGTGSPVPAVQRSVAAATQKPLAIKKPAAVKKPVAVEKPAVVKKSVPMVSNTPKLVANKRKVRIVLDPGHGGRDPGALGSFGMREKEVTLDISRRVRDLLVRNDLAEVTLTRTSDRFVSLEGRKDFANGRKADLFVSIHANSSTTTGLHGVETYTLDNSNNRAILRLAKAENGVGQLIKDDVSGADTDLKYILSDLVQTGKEAESVVLAGALQSSVLRNLGRHYGTIHSLGVKKGPFLVLDGVFMPCALIEVGFLSHKTEGPRLGAAVYRQMLAEGIYDGLREYLSDERVASLR